MFRVIIPLALNASTQHSFVVPIYKFKHKIAFVYHQYILAWNLNTQVRTAGSVSRQLLIIPDLSDSEALQPVPLPTTSCNAQL